MLTILPTSWKLFQTPKTALDLLAPKASPTFMGTATFTDTYGLTKAMVGPGNVDNTSDKLKVVSDATKTALDLLAPKASPSFTGTATFVNTSGLTQAMVGLDKVDNTSDKLKVVSDLTQAALDTLTTGLTGKEPVFAVLSPFVKTLQLSGPNAISTRS